MTVISSSSLAPGEPLVIRNISKTATTYRVDFTGAGEVRFAVLPGGEFTITGGRAGVVNVYIEDTAPPGIAPLDD